MSRLTNLFVLFFAVFLIQLARGQEAVPEQRAFKVMKSTPGELLISLRPFDLQVTPLTLEQGTYQLLTAPGFGASTTPGHPMLPLTGALIQIPNNADVSVNILESSFEEIVQIEIPPVPEVKEDSNADDLSYSYKKDPAIYQTDRYWPPTLAEFSGEGRWRGRRVGRIQIAPVQYNPVRKALRVYKSLTVRVSFSKPFAQTRSLNRKPGDSFEKLARSILLNGDFDPGAHRDILTKPLAGPSWYNPQATYYKLLVDAEGIYSLTYEELVNAGVAVDLLDLPTLKILHQGVQIPLQITGPQGATFSPNDTLYFYGDRHRGDSTYYDLYSDTNVYWLTSDGDPGLRYQVVPENSSPAVAAPYYWETLHVEKDSLFYRWKLNSTLDPGEGWVWRYLFDDDRESFAFEVSGLNESVSPCSLSVRLQGTTRDPVNPDHHVRISINDQVVGEGFFDERDELILRLAIPTSLLHDGKNKFELHLVPDTGAQVNQIYLDWVELKYPRAHVAGFGQLKFQNQTATRFLTEYSLVNFPDSEVRVFAPNSGKMWQPQTQRLSIHRIESAGFDDGNFVRIVADFQTFNSIKRGHNLVAIDSQTGAVESKHFDTFASSEEADALADYIGALPEGSVVLAGIADDGSAQMTEKAYQALESVGSALAREVNFRDSWALIGWKGAGAGTVAEVLSRRFQGAAVLTDTLRNQQAFRYAASFKDIAEPQSFYYSVDRAGIKKVKQIFKDTSSDLHNPSNGADYLIITHKNFAQQARSLADYRSVHNGFRSMVVDVQDTFDEFNGGVVSPQAIKDFVNYAYLNWEKPAPAFLVLLGDASWDPKKLMAQTTKTNYVPTYGDPVTDNWFVTLDGPKDILPEMFVGRIPVETPEQAEVIINKIVAYEKLPFDSWNKEFVFFNGGINSNEQRIFLSQANNLIEKHIETLPFNGEATQFNKTTNEAITLSLRKSAAQKIKEGALWVNFLGHAGSSVWDIDIGKPEDWQNQEVFPFMTGMSCHSARFANPVINSLSEAFVLNPIGAAAYWGSTGFGFITQDFFLLDSLFPAVTKAGVRSVGEATTLAKVGLWARLGDQQINRNVINQYELIGDPALSLALSTKPELAVRANEIAFESDFLLSTDSTTTLSAKVRNYGIVADDSVEVRFAALDAEGKSQPIAMVKIKPLTLIDSVTATWRIPEVPGVYRIQCEIDPANLIGEADEVNNVAEKAIHVFKSDLSIIKPLPFGVVATSKPALVTNNSRIGGENIRYYFEVDTSRGFNSPLLQRSPPVAEGRLVTQWQPQLGRPGVYTWRVQTFDGESFGPWVGASFSYLPESALEWQQSDVREFSRKSLQRVSSTTDDKLQLKENELIYRAESAGFLDGGRALLAINDKTVGAFFRGHNLAVFEGNTGDFVSFQVFDTFKDQANADAMAELINGLPAGQIVMAAILDEGSASMTENAYQALESIGSSLTRQVKFRDSWAIIGRKGAPKGSVPEAMSKAGEGPVVIADTLFRFEKLGTVVSPEIGPVLAWKSLRLSFRDSPPQERVRFQIVGLNSETGKRDSVMTNIANVQEVDLSGIGARKYPTIALTAVLTTETGLNTPQFNSWSLDFVPPPDLVVGRGAIAVSADTVLAGTDVEVGVDVGNFGLSPADSLAIRFLRSDAAAGNVEFGRAQAAEIAVDEIRHFSATLPTVDLQGKVRITLEADSEKEVPEIHENNNRFSRFIWVVRDTVIPEIRVTFDGRAIANGDLVATNPNIVVEVRDAGNKTVQDTAQVFLILDDERVSYGPNPNQAQLLPQDLPDDPDLQALVVFSPQLADGEHTLEIIAKDPFDNVRFVQNQFFVNSEFVIANVMNVPNPFRNETDFTYVLTQPADEVRLKIYTIAGRLIRELDFAPTRTGFNKFHWNGRDHDGDSLSNGVYLYKIIARRGDQQREVVDKFVVVR